MTAQEAVHTWLGGQDGCGQDRCHRLLHRRRVPCFSPGPGFAASSVNYGVGVLEKPIYYDIHVSGTLNVLDAARAAGCERLVFPPPSASSGWAGRGRAGRPTRSATPTSRICSCACRKPHPHLAIRRYSLIKPPTQARFRMRYWSRSTGCGSGFRGAAACKERCGRCRL